jgi:hypothetical protein
MSSVIASGVFRGGGIVPWPPLWRMRKFFEGLEGRWKGGWPPIGRIYGSRTENWRLEKVSKKRSPSWMSVGCPPKKQVDSW